MPQREYTDEEIARCNFFRDEVQLGHITDETICCWIKVLAARVVQQESNAEWLRGLLTGISERTHIPYEKMMPR